MKRNDIDKLIQVCMEAITYDYYKDGAKDTFLLGDLRTIAEYVLLGGYFMAGDTRIRVTDMEFYFHQEGDCPGLIKDPIMYHTYDHERDALHVQRRLKDHPEWAKSHDEDKALPYFAPGTINPHASGLDFTFENEERKYRASFLVRGYLVMNENRKETRSTYLYDDLLFQGIPTVGEPNIAWIEEKQEGSLDYIYPRHNVAAYEYDENGFPKRDENGKFIKKKADESSKFTFGVNGIRYEKCDRSWRFKLK